MTDSDAHAIAGYSVEVQTKKNITNIAEIVGKPKNEHGDARKVGHRDP